MPIISVQSASADEFSSDPVFIITLDSASTQTVTVEYRTISNGSAIAGVDFQERVGTITFLPGETQQTVTITNIYSAADESDENFTFELHSPDNATLDGGGIVLQATGVIEDSNGAANDPALFVSDPKILDTDGGGQVALFEIRLSEPAPGSLTLNYATADGTATAGSDYTATSGSVTFLGGEQVRYVSVPILGDTTPEEMEFFSLNVTPAGFIQNGVEDNSGIATILSDDTAGTGPVINIESATADEFSEDPLFIITLSEPALQTVTVEYRTVADGSAIAGVDFTEVFGTLTFLPGETQKTIQITNRYAATDESDENFSLELHSPDNATLAGDDVSLKATGVILDSNGSANNLALFVSDPIVTETDGAGRFAIFEIRLSTPSANTITMDYATADGTAIAGSDYTATSGTISFAPGQTVASVAVPITGDTVAELTETFSLTVTPNGFIQNGTADSTGTATILSDDTDDTAPVISIRPAEADEFSEDARFVVTLSEPALQTVTVEYRTVADGSAVAGRDFSEAFGTLTFAPGETQQVIQITNQYSAEDEADENFSVELHSPDNATLAGDGISLKATGVILDSNGDANNLALFVSDPILVEGDSGTTLAIFEIQLSRPSENTITLDYETIDGTATAGEDYTASSGSLTFAPGQTLVSVAVPVTGDTDIEATETFSLRVTPNGFIQNGVDDNTGIATIVADDTNTGGPVVTLRPAVADEFSEDARFVVTLSEAALQTVTVDFRTIANGSAVAGADFTEVLGTLTFAPGETQQVIQITNQYSVADESDESFSVELFHVDNASFAGDADSLSATGVILDSNGSANNLALFVSDPRIVEGDSGSRMAVFEITLSGPSENAIVLNYATADASARAGEDYTATTGSITFQPGQTITTVEVPILGDTNVEGNEQFSLNVTPNGFIQNGVEDSSGIATILADDSGTDLPILSVREADASEFYEDPIFWVRLSEPSTQTVTVQYRTIADGSATSEGDYRAATGTVTFNPGETEKAVQITNLYHPDNEHDENFSLELFSPDNAVLADDVSRSKTTGVILDSDGDANNLALFVSDPRVVETDGLGQFAVFEIRLSVPSENAITMNYTTSDGTAIAGSDYEATTGTVTFTPGQTIAAVHVPIIGDFAPESNETFSLVVTPNGFIQNGTDDSTGYAVIESDDFDLGLAVSSETRREGALGPRTMTFTVTLENASDQVETFSYRTVDRSATAGRDYTGVSGELVFEAGETSKTVEVVIRKDLLTEGTERFALEVTENPGTAFETTETGIGTILDYDFSVANTINGTSGADVIKSGGGKDRVNGKGGNDDIFGGSGSDRLYGNAGRDDLYGGGSGDRLFGGTGNDRLFGGSGSDVLKGGAGSDRLFGGGQSDVLYGNGGRDVLVGGGGADRFVFTRESDSGTTRTTRDVIKDFDRGQNDKIDLRPMDAKTGRGNQEFDFIGQRGFSDTKGELRVVDTGRDILVQGDRDGDGRADFTILVEGVARLTEDDFLL